MAGNESHSGEVERRQRFHARNSKIYGGFQHAFFVVWLLDFLPIASAMLEDGMARPSIRGLIAALGGLRGLFIS